MPQLSSTCCSETHAPQPSPEALEPQYAGNACAPAVIDLMLSRSAPTADCVAARQCSPAATAGHRSRHLGRRTRRPYCRLDVVPLNTEVIAPTGASLVVYVPLSFWFSVRRVALAAARSAAPGEMVVLKRIDPRRIPRHGRLVRGRIRISSSQRPNSSSSLFGRGSFAYGRCRYMPSMNRLRRFRALLVGLVTRQRWPCAFLTDYSVSPFRLDCAATSTEAGFVRAVSPIGICSSRLLHSDAVFDAESHLSLAGLHDCTADLACTIRSKCTLAPADPCQAEAPTRLVGLGCQHTWLDL